MKETLVIDIDLHYGTGTDDIFGGRSDVILLDAMCQEGQDHLSQPRERLALGNGHDITGVGAGFDTYENDWAQNPENRGLPNHGQLHRGSSQILPRQETYLTGRRLPPHRPGQERYILS